MPSGKYQYVKKLATGGMAEVWLAKQTGIEGFNRHVVVKRILPHLAEDPEFVQMFLNEAKIAARFNHPNIGQIFDLGEENGTYFIAMEFIHGEDLGRVMRRAWSSGQWIARHLSLRIVADTCQGLHYAHTRVGEQGQPLKVVHRDISPQNVLISFDGAVKVVDFGIAKAADQVSNTRSGAIKGKFAYMAPEQAGGKPLDARTDLFALGLVLYELVTGVRPLKRESELATLQAALACEIEPPSGVAEVPPEIDAVVMRALAKNPDDRYRDAREFQRAIEQYLVDHKELATSVQVSELMETLFADRLSEERRLGVPNPSSDSSTSNPIPSREVEAARSEAPRREEAAQGETLVGEAPPPTVFARGAPEGTVGPSRRYATAPPARPSRVEVTRAAAASETSLQPVDGGAEPPRRPSRPAASPDAGSRRGSGGAPRATRPPASSAMPEAPARRSKLVPEATNAGAEEEGVSRLVDVKALRARAASRLRTLVVVVVLAGTAVVLAVVGLPLAAQLSLPATPLDGVAVPLSVTTNPPTAVWVYPPEGSGRTRTMLGRSGATPLSGAYVGDTVALINEDFGIHWEERLEYGEPNKPVSIAKSFVTVSMKVKTSPRLRSASVWRLDPRGVPTQKLGEVGLALDMYPGVHQLAIQSDQLTDPVPFTASIPEGKTVTEVPVDVSKGLEKPAQ